jgi:glycine/D-amino acid oxidase-like deaminating enzyme/nitrite reductase/ring-hydroxylating ferredoxin subunit
VKGSMDGVKLEPGVGGVSLWIGTTPGTGYGPLREPRSVDVAVIGAGIAGLTTALLLVREGARVAVVEARRLAMGTTGYTTAKVTSLHGLTYQKLLSSLGEEPARQYAEANQAALERVAGLVDELGIDCDFRRMAAFTYAEQEKGVSKIEQEVEAARKLGLPAAYVEETPLPFPVRAAVRFDGQALFHPRKYCLALAAALAGQECPIFEQTRALDVTEDPGGCRVETDRGAIAADHVVVATHLPFVNRGLFFAKTHPERSYALATRIRGAPPEGMFLSDDPTRSIRPHPLGDETFLIIGGEGHKVGQDQDTRQRYAALEAWAKERFDVASVDYRWSAQDYMPVDTVPYIGKMTPGSERLWVATGFRKWGMTNGTAAGMLLSELIQGRSPAWAPVFDATRVRAKASAKELVSENVDALGHLVGDRLATAFVPPLAELERDEGRVVEADGEKVAAYRDEQGAIFAVSPTCTHMGCVVSWNTAEKSWDCPCHGSRFDPRGRVIQGPAVEDLKSKALPETAGGPPAS